MDPPAGTVALLFTDIEGSTRLARALGPGWAAVLEAHHRIVGGAIAEHGGWVERTEGDSFFATFADPAAAARAAVVALRALRSHAWPEPVGELGVRMGLHVGHVERRESGYVGLEIHRAARVGAAAHGGQLLLTAAADALRPDDLPTQPLGGHRLKDFPAPEQLFCAVVDGRGASAFPPPRTLDVRPTNLPAGGPALIGRDADLERVRAALLAERERLVTLTGRGGTGKTSLAREAGIALLDEHPAGVWFVRLAALTAPGDVLPAIARALNADGPPESTPEDLVTGRLRERGPALLILDNLEHLVEAAPALDRLLGALPDVRMLVTSQRPLHLRRERCLPLDTLDDESALALVERTTLRVGGSVGEGREALLDVVHLLDGLPLALELAAARLRVLTPAQLRDRLRDSTVLLSDRTADRDERQRSLQATVDWTLGLLDDEPRELFARMGAFARAAELDDLEAVAGADGLDVLDALATLLEVALVRRVEDGDGAVRFGLPEALRQVAAARLDAAPDGADWRLRHAGHQLAIAWEARFGNSSSLAAHRRAVTADAEARTALRWARAAAAPLADPLAAAVAMRIAGMGRATDAMEVLGPLAGSASGDPDLDAMVALVRAQVMIMRGDGHRALTCLEGAVPLDVVLRAITARWRSFTLTSLGDTAGGVAEAERAVALARESGSVTVPAVLMMCAQAHLFHEQVELARERFAEAESENAREPVQMLEQNETFRGDLAMKLGHPDEALEPYARSLSAAEAMGNELQMLLDLLGITTALAELGRDAEALEAVGLTEAQGTDVSSTRGSAFGLFSNLLGDTAIAAATQRLGDASAEHLARGRAVPAGRRVAAACALARAPVTR